MPRATNGVFTLTSGNPVVPGTVIESFWANTTLGDIAFAITDSLSRSGDGGMLAPLTLVNNNPTNPLHAASKGYVDASISAIPPVDIPASEILSKLLTVDGTGSGLDADLLDGQSGAYYLDLANATGTLPPSAGGFPEAPNDGQQYVRKSLAWASLVVPPSGIPEAPIDGQQYARQSAAWTVVAATPTGLGTMAYNDFTVNDIAPAAPTIGDRWVKPSTGEEMVRVPLIPSGEAWIIPAAGLPEAPDDGKQYARQSRTWTQVSAPTSLGNMSTMDFTVDDVAPAGPIVGDRWIKPSTGEELVRVPATGGDTWVNPSASAQLPLPLSVANGGTGSTVEKYLPLVGGTLDAGAGSTSLLTIKSTTNGTDLTLDSPAYTLGSGVIRSKRLGLGRWTILPGDNTAESGSNAGSNFIINRHDDAGASLGAAFAINRATGDITIPGSIVGRQRVMTGPNVSPTVDPGWGGGFGVALQQSGTVVTGTETTNICGLWVKNGAGPIHSFRIGTLIAAPTTIVGGIDTNGSTTSFVTTSDYRYKENIVDLESSLETVLALKPRRFKWKNGGVDVGFIAHELQELVPGAVTGEKDAVDEEGNIKPQGTDLSFVIPYLVKAIQELAARIP